MGKVCKALLQEEIITLQLCQKKLYLSMCIEKENTTLRKIETMPKALKPAVKNE